MRAAIYARVSAVDQNSEMQLKELREYCQQRGWTIMGEYVDTGWSGAKASRPELDRIMKDAGQHLFDCICVWRLERFGRSVRHAIRGLRSLDSWSIRFIATNQGFDTNQQVPTRLLLVPIMTAVADFEREMMSERVKVGLEAARKTGVKLGRPKVVLDRKKATAMRRRGLSIRAIAAEVGVSKGTVERLFRTETAGPNR